MGFVMNNETITWIWLIAGVLLMLSEFLVPGLVVIFLGFAAILIALARWMGLINSLLDSFTYWFVLTVAIILTLRGFVARFASGDATSNPSDENEEAYGKIVKVTEEVDSNHDEGRIQFRGTTWKARCDFGWAIPGQQVQIVRRENLVWIVHPIEMEGQQIPKNSLVKMSAKKFLIGAKKSKRFVKRE